MTVQAQAIPLDIEKDANATRLRELVQWDAVVAGLPAVLAAVLWLISVSSINTHAIGDYGLLAILPISYYVAVALLVASFVIALCRQRVRAWVLRLHIVTLIFVIHGTVQLTFPEPHYAWVYKHIGVVDYIIKHGSVNSHIDIYHNWPGFFSGAAWLTQLMGAPMLQWVGWAQVFFNLVFFLELSVIYQALGVPVRVKWLSLFLFFSCNWVGQDYFSPQGFTFALALALFAVVVTWQQHKLGGPLAFVAEKTARLVRIPNGPTAEAPLPGWFWVVSYPWKQTAIRNAVPVSMIVLIFALITVSHQLTPYMILASLTGLAVFGGIRPRWLVPVLAAIAGSFLLLHYSYIVNKFGPIFGTGDLVSNATTRETTLHPTFSVGLVSVAARALAAIIWLVGTIGLLVRVRAGDQRDLLIGVMAFAPFFLLGGQSYGGEAIFRVFLFSLPWMSLFVAYILLARQLWQRLSGTILITASVAVLLTLALVPYFGIEQINVESPGEVAGTTYLYQNAPENAKFFPGDEGLPSRIDARYSVFALHGDNDIGATITDQPEFSNRMIGAADMPALDKWVDQYNSPAFVIFSTEITAFNQAYGRMPDGSLASLESVMSKDPGWKIWYNNADMRVYERVQS